MIPTVVLILSNKELGYFSAEVKGVPIAKSEDYELLKTRAKAKLKSTGSVPFFIDCWTMLEQGWGGTEAPPEMCGR
jgi:hypothetical protein